jgi:hypothetical protein
MITNDGVVSDALKFVERKKEHIDILQEMDETIEKAEGDNHKRSILV